MADTFIDVGVETDAQTLADDAIDRLRTEWDGWEPNDGDLEVVQVEAIAPMAQNAAETAAKVPPAAFRNVLEKLHGIPYEAGAAATTTVTVMFTDADVHTVNAGDEIDIDGFAFRVDDDATGTSPLAGVAVTATAVGAAANGLTGTTRAPISALSFLDDFTVDAPTSGGADPEDDTAYQNRGSRELELQAKTLVTERDYELMGLSEPGVGRIIALSDAATKTMRVIGTDPAGAALSTAVKTSLAGRYEDYRLTNWTLSIEDATYTPIDVTYAVKAYPGFDVADLETRIDAMLADWLAPGVWGRPKNFGDPGSPGAWVLDTVVRRNKLIDLIGDVDGVNYVDTLTIAGSAGSAEPDGDWTLPGTVPLTQPGTITGTVT